ncbi:MAG TPA: thioesterase family protein [Longimicrobiales bacterium]
MKTSERVVRQPADAAAAPFRVLERARWSDVDAAGIVCYGAYLRFFEVAETELFRSFGLPIGTLQQQHRLWLVRRRVECDFFRPILLDEEVEVFAYITAVGRTSLGVGFLARRLGERELAAESRYALVAVDAERLTPVPLPEMARELLVAARLDRTAVLGALGLAEHERGSGRES